MGNLKCVLDDKVVSFEKVNFMNDMYKCSNGNKYYIFMNNDDAGETAREYYAEMADKCPDEILSMVGVRALIEWSRGCSYAAGCIGVSSLDEWLDLWLNNPEEHFACDGVEINIEKMNKNMQEEFCGLECVAYKC